jgi:hypothetical protein
VAMASAGGARGSVRAWSRHVELPSARSSAHGESGGGAGALAPAGESGSGAHSGDVVVTYQISGNRWCRRIGRAHKSNHVFYVVVLRARATGGGAVWAQGCHDPECRGYQSALAGVPPEALPSQHQPVLEHEQQEEQHGRRQEGKEAEEFDCIDDTLLLASIDANPDGWG